MVEVTKFVVDHCVMCPDVAIYISPDTQEFLCGKCARIDMEIRRNKGK